MASSFFYQDDEYSMFQDMMARRSGIPPRRFDEYYRCYPVAMLPGPDREGIEHGGKVFLPASALEKLTKLHISYPMLFELINGAKERTTHAGVLEFIAEEGKIYLPNWLMNTLLLEAGDLVQIKSTDLPAGQFIKLQPQSTDFLEISDPKAVLENAFRNFSCLTVGDVFSFEYNDTVFEVAVLEVKPDLGTHAIYTMETDLSVDFAPPKGYVEPSKHIPAAASAAKPAGGKISVQGTMAQEINYSAIAPSSTRVAAGENAVSSHFSNGGQRLGSKKTSAKSTPGTSTPVGASGAAPAFAFPRKNNANGAQPLRLPPGKLFFGFEYIPPKKKDADGKVISESDDMSKPRFQGMGQTLRGKKVDAQATEEQEPDSTERKQSVVGGTGDGGQRLGRKADGP